MSHSLTSKKDQVTEALVFYTKRLRVHPNADEESTEGLQAEERN